MSDISLRDTIKAAMSGEPAEAAEAPAVVAAEPAVAEAAAAPPVAEPSPAPEPEAQEAPAAEAKPGDAARDDKGRFAAKAGEPTPNDPEAAKPAEPEPPTEETIRVPPGLPTQLKAKFKELPAEWREAFAAQESSFQVVKGEWQPKAERLNRLDGVLAPLQPKLTANGVNEVQWIERLIAAETLLSTNPTAGILELARTYGADPRQIVAQMTGGQPAGQQQMQPGLAMDPNLQHLLGEIQTLKQTVTQQQESAKAEQLGTVQAQVKAFADDPAHLYFEDVREHVAALLAGGQATTLKDAYDMACWAVPAVRDALIQERLQANARETQQAQAAQAAAAAQAAQQSAQRAKATVAAQAAGSVTGAPGPGAGQGLVADPSNLRATIQAAMEQASGRV